VNFQVTVLKVLVSYPDGFAAMADLKRDMAILATNGRDWTERTKRLAARVPGLDIFAQGLVETLNGGWRISPRRAAPFSRSWRRGRRPPRQWMRLPSKRSRSWRRPRLRH